MNGTTRLIEQIGCKMRAKIFQLYGRKFELLNNDRIDQPKSGFKIRNFVGKNKN